MIIRLLRYHGYTLSPSSSPPLRYHGYTLSPSSSLHHLIKPGIVNNTRIRVLSTTKPVKLTRFVRHNQDWVTRAALSWYNVHVKPLNITNELVDAVRTGNVSKALEVEKDVTTVVAAFACHMHDPQHTLVPFKLIAELKRTNTEVTSMHLASLMKISLNCGDLDSAVHTGRALGPLLGHRIVSREAVALCLQTTVAHADVPAARVVIRAFQNDSVYERQLCILYGSAISAFACAGLAKEAVQLFRDWERIAARKKWKVRIKECTSALAGLATIGDYKKAEEAYKVLMDTIVPDGRVYATLMTAFYRGGEHDRVMKLLGNVREANVPDEEKRDFFTIALSSCAENGAPLSTAVELFNECPLKDAVTYTAMMKCYNMNEACEDAIKLFHLWRDSVPPPNSKNRRVDGLYRQAMSACVKTGDYDSGVQLFEEMVEKGVQTSVHWELLYDCLRLKGKRPEPLQFIRRISQSGAKIRSNLIQHMIFQHAASDLKLTVDIIDEANNCGHPLDPKRYDVMVGKMKGKPRYLDAARHLWDYAHTNGVHMTQERP